MPGSPVLRYLLEFSQTHVPWVSDAQLPVGDFWSRLLSAYLFLLQILLFGLPFSSFPIPGINPLPLWLPGLQVLSIQLHPTAHWELGFRIPSAASSPCNHGQCHHSYISWLLRPSPARAWLVPRSLSFLLSSFCQREVRHSKSWYWGRTRCRLGWPANLVRMTRFPVEKNEINKWPMKTS